MPCDLKQLVGMTGFEPATPSSRTKCTTKLCYIPMHQLFYHYTEEMQVKILRISEIQKKSNRTRLISDTGGSRNSHRTENWSVCVQQSFLM